MDVSCASNQKWIITNRRQYCADKIHSFRVSNRRNFLLVGMWLLDNEKTSKYCYSSYSSVEKDDLEPKVVINN